MRRAVSILILLLIVIGFAEAASKNEAVEEKDGLRITWKWQKPMTFAPTTVVFQATVENIDKEKKLDGYLTWSVQNGKGELVGQCTADTGILLPGQRTKMKVGCEVSERHLVSADLINIHVLQTKE